MRLNKNTLPQYLDGCLDVYSIVQSEDPRFIESLKNEHLRLWFEERGITDRLRNELNSSKTTPERKVRIPQDRKIDNMTVVKIDDKYYRVYNAYHFINKDGFAQSDLTLLNYHVYKDGE